MTATNSLLAASLSVTLALAVWGVVSPETLLPIASDAVQQFFHSRGWFLMLLVSGMLLMSIWLAVSRYGDLRLGADDERPEFSTASWLAMLFSAGMGVGLLFFAVAEPLTHFRFASQHVAKPEAAELALKATLFHWGVHAWAIYGSIALIIAYFSFRRGAPMLVSGPIRDAFPDERWARVVAWLGDFMSIVAIAIGVGGSIAMGVLQVGDGTARLIGADAAGPWIIGAVLTAIVAAYIPALLVELGDGMSKLSNLAMLIAIALVCYTIVLGPTQYLLNAVVESFGGYAAGAIPHGFRTFTFFDDSVQAWFSDWTLTYMVWWLAWGPFVGVFVARISRGRTIRGFVAGVLLGPTLFSIIWFGTFGGIGLYEALNGPGELSELTATDIETVTFALLERLPIATVTTVATLLAAFLFIVTSVVSAAFVLATFSTGGDPNPRPRVRLLWGVLLGLLGLAMVTSGSLDAIKKLIAIGALPFVFISVLLIVCFLRALRQEEIADASR